MTAVIRIDPNEQFPHLSRAPIVEAVIEIRARALAPWDEGSLANHLKAKLPDYPQAKAAWESVGECEFRGAEAPQQRVTGHGWTGIRAQSTDGHQIALFDRDRFAFSRLTPYEDRQRFTAEALRLGEIHLGLARATEIQRIGVRFINQLLVPGNEVDLERPKR